jgi:tRNA modification GTPase
MEAMVDFVEDDIPPRVDAATRATLMNALGTINSLLDGAEQGIILREGASLVIVGSPNVGKSSIMNALLGLDRSIVTPIAGTTRDTIEEMVDIRGVPFRTIDTAGITQTADFVERIGVERSRQALSSADVVLLVFDRSRSAVEGDAPAIDAVRSALASADPARTPRVVVALNKADLPRVLDAGYSPRGLTPLAVVETIAVTSGGIDELREALARAALGGERHDFVVGNVRHQDALRRAAAALQTALNGFETGTPLDLLSFDVRAAAQAIGEITGRNVDDELLDRIFRDFCIGK